MRPERQPVPSSSSSGTSRCPKLPFRIPVGKLSAFSKTVLVLILWAFFEMSCLQEQVTLGHVVRKESVNQTPLSAAEHSSSVRWIWRVRRALDVPRLGWGCSRQCPEVLCPAQQCSMLSTGRCMSRWCTRGSAHTACASGWPCPSPERWPGCGRLCPWKPRYPWSR